MPSIRITNFSGLRPKVSSKLLKNNEAQIAQNVLLRDGKLRPTFDWKLFKSGVFHSLIKGDLGIGTTPVSQPRWDVYFNDLALNPNIVNGSNVIEVVGSTSVPVLPVPLVHPPSFLSSGFTWATVISENRTSRNLTTTPIARAYAITYINRDGESPPIVLDVESGSASTPFFEGDILSLEIGIREEIFAHTPLFFKVYRTVSKPRTGEQLTYDFNTDFLLLRSYTFQMAQSVTPSFRKLVIVDDLFDADLKNETLTSFDNTGPCGTFSHLGRLESGRYWLFGTTEYNGEIESNTLCVSKLNNKYAWPISNRMKLNFDTRIPFYSTRLPVSTASHVYDVVSFRNSLIFGTVEKPIIVEVTDTENGPTFSQTVLSLDEPCVKNTLCSTSFGAVYTSYNGVVAINQAQQNMLSKELFEFGSNFWNPSNPNRFPKYAFYWDGRYYILGLLGNTEGVCLQVDPNEHSVDFGALTTFKHPELTLQSRNRYFSVETPFGVYALFDDGVYFLHRTDAISSGVPVSPSLSNYVWRSKKFVLNEPTAFSAAKVVHDASGPLAMNLYLDGRLVFSRAITHSRPFTLPRSRKGLEWEIELCGKSVVEEVHIATSMAELVEVYNNDA
jgi:hypothetical protein